MAIIPKELQDVLSKHLWQTNTNGKTNFDFLYKSYMDFSTEKFTLEDDAYEKFASLCRGPVNRSHFTELLWEEADYWSKINRGVAKDHIGEALRIMMDSYIVGMGIARIITKIGPADFVALTRRAPAWAMLLRMSHEPDFNLITWFATQLPRQ